jgi:hypothetical protein
MFIVAAIAEENLESAKDVVVTTRIVKTVFGIATIAKKELRHQTAGSRSKSIERCFSIIAIFALNR